MRRRGGATSVGTALLLGLLALAAARPAQALTTISTNTTITSANSIHDDVQVLGAATLTVAAGGSISGHVDAYDTSTVNITGGSLGGGLVAHHSSKISLSSGEIALYAGYLESVYAADSSTVTVVGGSIDGTVNARGGSTVSISGGRINGITTFQSARVSVTGGSFSFFGGGLAAFGGTIDVYGCPLRLSDGGLFGTLKDGTPIAVVAGASNGGKIVVHTCPLPPDTVPPEVSGGVSNYEQYAQPPQPPSIFIIAQDTDSGLASVVVTSKVNCTVSVPWFDRGTTYPVYPTVTRLVKGQNCSVGLRATDVAGNVTNYSGTFDVDPPTLTLTRTLIGPPQQVQITVQDTGSGLATIAPYAENATVSVPPFTPGTTAPVVVTVTKIDQSKKAVVYLRATDVTGNFADF